MYGLSKPGCACLLAACGALALGAHGGDEAAEYSIRMNRPMEVGQKFSVRALGIQQYDLSESGAANPGDRRVLTVGLEGEARVLAVDTHGRPTAMQYLVANCTMDRNGRTTELARAGALLEARDRNGTTQWQIDGRPASADVNATLRMFGLFTGEQTVDEILGTTQPRTIGESWVIDRQGVARAISTEIGRDLDHETVFGASTLVDTADHGGTPCMVVYTHVSADNCPPPGGTAEGMQVRSSNATATFQGVYPRNPNAPVLSTSRNVTVKALVVDATGSERELNWSRFVEFAMTPKAGSGRVATGAEAEVVDE